MSSEIEMDKLVNELQSKLAFQEDALTSLNDVVIGLQRDLIELRQLIMAINQRVSDQGEIINTHASIDIDAPPPHY
tara:strand:- start:312 stop:539 length:228 start_codon:yes stop_codon:yes gene_type:complete